jgi:hypothetical protein
MWFYMKYMYTVNNRKWRILMSMDCTYPPSTFYSNLPTYYSGEYIHLMKTENRRVYNARR